MSKRRRHHHHDRDDAPRLSDARYREIAALCEELDELPDGAFLGVLDECGVDVDELAAYSAEHARRHPDRLNDRRVGRTPSTPSTGSAPPIIHAADVVERHRTP